MVEGQLSSKHLLLPNIIFIDRSVAAEFVVFQNIQIVSGSNFPYHVTGASVLTAAVQLQAVTLTAQFCLLSQIGMRRTTHPLLSILLGRHRNIILLPVSTLTIRTGRAKEYGFVTHTVPVHSSLLKLFCITWSELLITSSDIS
jgi:hypothetical protein